MMAGDNLVAAASWLRELLLGSVVSAIAVLAVAAVGVAMLSGRIELRRSATVILGCFLLFAAPVIATGLRAALAGNEPVVVAETSPAPPVVVLPAQPAPPAVYDPYAGAAVPQLR